MDTVGRLIEEGKMKQTGLKCVEEAKVDGRWERAYAGPASIEVPADFVAALDADRKAEQFFATLNKSERYAVLWRVETASPKARVGRIETIVGMLNEGRVPGVEDRVKWKVNKTVKTKRDAVEKNITNKKSPVVKGTVRAGNAQKVEAVVEGKPKQSRRTGLRART